MLFKKLPEFVLVFCVVLYSLFLSYLTITRMHNFRSHYFDLGLMHQATYNSYQAIKTFDFGKILEQTDTYKGLQIKRMAIHNDMLLALLSVFYFIHNGAETLLVLQSVILALGAFAVYLIAYKVFSHKLIGLIFALAYLLNPFVQRTNLFDFHAVTLSTSFLLFMFYFWLVKKYKLSLVFLVLALISKEQVGLVTGFMGIYYLLSSFWSQKKLFFKKHIKKQTLFLNLQKFFITEKFSLVVIFLSIIWFLLSIKFIIPYFRIDDSVHFAMHYFQELGTTPVEVLSNTVLNPIKFIQQFINQDTIVYISKNLSYTGYLAILSPFILLISLPEFAINILSSNQYMRNTYFHYTALITPIVFIASIYGSKYAYDLLSKKIPQKLVLAFLSAYIIIFTIISAYNHGPLFFSKNKERSVFQETPQEQSKVLEWRRKLADYDIKVASTGDISSFFSGRRYFYFFDYRYKKADYVVLLKDDALFARFNADSAPAYKELKENPNFKLLLEEGDLEVYQKVK